jgi:hypothetical protein
MALGERFGTRCTVRKKLTGGVVNLIASVMCVKTGPPNSKFQFVKILGHVFN